MCFLLSYYSKHHKLFTHETQPHFLLKRSFLLSSGAWTSELPWAGGGPQGFPTCHSPNTWGYHCQLLPGIPTVPRTQLSPWWEQTSLGGVGAGGRAEMGQKRVWGQFLAGRGDAHDSTHALRALAPDPSRNACPRTMSV